jgi:predicted signal transduction protein with EAL and GGDEF domain
MKVEPAVDRILALKALSVAVSVDDFGTGNSSLAHLKRFPLDALKIDRFFIKDLPSAPAKEASISSILSAQTRLSDCSGLFHQPAGSRRRDHHAAATTGRRNSTRARAI